MKPEIYKAMLKRISKIPSCVVETEYRDRGWKVPQGHTFYRLDAEGLGEDVDSIVQPMKTKNPWNVAQRFYGFLLIQFNNDKNALDNALTK